MKRQDSNLHKTYVLIFNPMIDWQYEHRNNSIAQGRPRER